MRRECTFRQDEKARPAAAGRALYVPDISDLGYWQFPPETTRARPTDIDP